MLKRKLFGISVLLILTVIMISSVSAVDLDNTTEDINDDSVLEIENDENILDESDEESVDATYQWFTDIQNQIDEAEEGATIELSGTYYGRTPIIINKEVKIVGTGDGATLKANINTNIKYPVFFINQSASNVVIDNLKISGGNYQWGGGIYLLADNTVISNCEFKDNSADGFYGYGGAIWLWASNCLVTNCTFTNNHCTDYGGAIYVNQKNNKISNCVFMYNYISNEINISEEQASWRGGGAIYSDCQGLIIDNCTFEENYARESSGGALKLTTYTSIRNSNFKSNVAASAKAINCGQDTYFLNNIFSLEYKENASELFEGVSVDDLLSYGNNVFNKTKIDSSVTYSAGIVFLYGASGSIMVTVDGGSVNESSIRVINHPEAKYTFTDNVLTVSNLGVGTYTLRLSTVPDDDHYSVDSDLKITVKKATAVIKASKLTVALKKGTAWTIKIIDSRNNKPISNMKVTLRVYTGKKYKTVTVHTNSKGVASYKTKSLSKGTHKVVASATHSGYNFNTVTSSITVVKQTKLTYKVKYTKAKDSSTVMFRVYKKGKPTNGLKLKLLVYTGKKVVKTINLKSKTFKKTKGMVGYTTNELSAGKHKIVLKPANIKYKGSKKGTLKLTKKQVKYEAISSKISG